jgi:hypothetical protein
LFVRSAEISQIRLVSIANLNRTSSTLFSASKALRLSSVASMVLPAHSLLQLVCLTARSFAIGFARNFVAAQKIKTIIKTNFANTS